MMGASVMVGNLMAVADVAALWAEAEKHSERARRRKTKKGEQDGPDANRSVRATQERAHAGGGAHATQEVTGRRRFWRRRRTWDLGWPSRGATAIHMTSLWRRVVGCGRCR